jgi:glycosyltransferase involved in cell wall biosynthesis
MQRCDFLMTKVLHLITALDSGGAQSMLLRVLSSERAPNSIRQVVVSIMDEGLYGEAVRALGIELHCLGCRRGLPSLAALWRLRGIMRDVAPDVVMTWLYHADLAGTFAALLGGSELRRLVWNLRCSHVDFSSYSKLTRWTVRVLAVLSGWPVAVATNSRAGRAEHEALGYRPRRWVFLPNGFDLQEFRPDAADRSAVRESLGLQESDFVVGIVARVDAMKDYATFLEAAKQLAFADRSVHFVMIGNGTDKLDLPRGLRGRATALGQRNDVPRLLRALDALVLCSLAEGFPNVVGEAMASGVACIVTDVGDLAHIVGDTGAIVPARSAEALAAGLLAFMRESPQLRLERGRRARARIAELFDLEGVATQYRALWREIADEAEVDKAAARESART